MKKTIYNFTLLFITAFLLISACDSAGVDGNSSALEGTWKSTEESYYWEFTSTTWADYDLIRGENCYDSFSSGYEILAREDNVYTVKFEGDSNEYEITIEDGVLTMRNDGEFIIQLTDTDVNVDTLPICN